jgi:hypothetical protein
VLWWILSTYHRRRRGYATQLAANSRIVVMHLRSPREADAWLRDVQPMDS